MNEASADTDKPHGKKNEQRWRSERLSQVIWRSPIAGAAPVCRQRAAFDHRQRAESVFASGDELRCRRSTTLRAFVTVLVVAHHSVLAYARVSAAATPRSPVHPWLAGIPIVDSHRLIGFDLFALFNDSFFMSLMFLLSGLFVGRAWRAKAPKLPA